MKTENQIRVMCEVRANLWRQFVSDYQRVMVEDSDLLPQYIADWQERYLRVGKA